MKQKVLAITLSTLFSFTSLCVHAAPSTKGKWSIGVQSPMTINTNRGSIISDNYISARWGFSDSINLNILGRLGLDGQQFSLTAGVQGEFKMKGPKDVQPYWGLGLIIGDIGLPNNQISLIPSFGVEYFLTENLSFDAALGLPISLASIKDQGIKFGGLTTVGRPVLGFHYYF